MKVLLKITITNGFSLYAVMIRRCALRSPLKSTTTCDSELGKFMKARLVPKCRDKLIVQFEKELLAKKVGMSWLSGKWWAELVAKFWC